MKKENIPNNNSISPQICSRMSRSRNGCLYWELFKIIFSKMTRYDFDLVLGSLIFYETQRRDGSAEGKDDDGKEIILDEENESAKTERSNYESERRDQDGEYKNTRKRKLWENTGVLGGKKQKTEHSLEEMPHSPLSSSSLSTSSPSSSLRPTSLSRTLLSDNAASSLPSFSSPSVEIDGKQLSKRKQKKEKKKLERKQKKKECKSRFCSSHYFQPKLMHRLDRDTSGESVGFDFPFLIPLLRCCRFCKGVFSPNKPLWAVWEETNQKGPLQYSSFFETLLHFSFSFNLLLGLLCSRLRSDSEGRVWGYWRSHRHITSAPSVFFVFYPFNLVLISSYSRTFIFPLPSASCYSHRIISPSGQPSHTHYEVIRRWPLLSSALLRVSPTTGRTHQVEGSC